MRILKKSRSFLKLLRRNFRRKVTSLLEWHKDRCEISNWFVCYLFSSSLIVELFATVRPLKRLMLSKTFRVKYRQGRILLITWDQLPALKGLLETYHHYNKYLKIQIADKDVIIDIGAHVGTFSLPLCYEHPGVQVYSFEPSPYNFRVLQENKRLNALPDERLCIKPVAVYGENGTFNFSLGQSSTTGSIKEVGFRRGTNSVGHVKCQTVTLGEIFLNRNITRCKLLKIDCEGSEFEILYNTPEDVIRRIDSMIIEAHITEKHNPLEMKAFLEAKGFYVDSLPLTNGCYELFATARQTSRLIKTPTANQQSHI